MRFFNLPTYSNTPGGTESIPSSDANQTDRRFTLSGLAQWIIENFTGSTLAGSAQSAKSAIDGLKTTATELDERTTATEVTATAAANVTIARQSNYTLNGMAYICMSITTSATIGGTTTIVSGLPKPSVAKDVILLASGDNHTAYHALINSGGILRFSTNSGGPAGGYILNAVYRVGA